MTPMNDLLGKDLKEIFPKKDLSIVSIGDPGGEDDGLTIGYAGWGCPDILLDPYMPLDMSLDRLNLNHSFKEVRSKYLLNCVHGDCMLEHTARGLMNAVALGGKLKIKVIATAPLAVNALKKLERGDFVGCQLLEKLCFRLAFDDTGLIYQQTFMDQRRLIAAFSGCLNIEKTCNIDNLAMRPDDFRIPDAKDDEKWRKSESNMINTESLDMDFPSCACCRRVATKADWNRVFFSRYCRNHYQVARLLWEQSIIDAYSIIGVLRG